MDKLEIGAIIAAHHAAPAERTIEVITDELLEAKRMAGENILTIGRCLIEAKAVLPHGEWAAWLAERVEFSERAAQRFMRLAREWSNPTALSDLGATKALTLLALPPEEREQFMAESHVVDGEEKTVIDMSARQLDQVIEERDEARQAVAHAEAEAKAAEDARAKMESDLTMLKGLLDAAQEEKEQSAAAVADLERQLEEMKSAPVDVAVMQVDQEQLEKARAEAIAEVQGKLDKAKEDKAKAVEKRKEAEAALEEIKVRLEEALRAEKRAALSGDRDVAAFEVLFNQAQELANKMQGILIKARSRDDQQVAEKLQKALLALADAISRAAAVPGKSEAV